MITPKKQPENIGFPTMRKEDKPKWKSDSVPTDPEVHYDEKTPKGPWQFWKYVLSVQSFTTIKDISPANERGKRCAETLGRLIKKVGMPRMMELGAYYAKSCHDIQKAYNWKYPASAVQFCMFIDKIDFCATNGIPLNPANRVVGGEDYQADPFAAMEAAMKKKLGS